MFIVSFACVLEGLNFYAQDRFLLLFSLQMSFVIALNAAAWEKLSSGGWDNCTVPLFSGLLWFCNGLFSMLFLLPYHYSRIFIKF
jgi:dolichol kinase